MAKNGLPIIHTTVCRK